MPHVGTVDYLKKIWRRRLSFAAAVDPYAAYIWFDTFNRADSVTALGTPDKSPGGAVYTVRTGTAFGLTSGRGYSPDASPANNKVNFDTGVFFSEITIDSTSNDWTNHAWVVAIREKDGSNYFEASITGAPGFSLYKRSAGSFFLMNTVTIAAVANSTHNVGLRYKSGNIIASLFDGVEIATYSLTTGEITQYNGVGYTLGDITLGALDTPGPTACTFDNLAVKA